MPLVAINHFKTQGSLDKHQGHLKHTKQSKELQVFNNKRDARILPSKVGCVSHSLLFLEGPSEVGTIVMTLYLTVARLNFNIIVSEDNF